MTKKKLGTSVRRSSSKKGILLSKQNSQSQVDTGPLAYQQQQQYTLSNLGDYVGEQLDWTDDDSIITTPTDRCTFADNNFKMQSCSGTIGASGGAAASGSGGEQQSITVDLTTENLPAVDTPDACDKAALR